MSARSHVMPIEQKGGIERAASNPDLSSQLEELRVHVLDCERWARFDDLLDLALRTAAWRKRAR